MLRRIVGLSLILAGVAGPAGAVAPSVSAGAGAEFVFSTAKGGGVPGGFATFIVNVYSARSTSSQQAEVHRATLIALVCTPFCAGGTYPDQAVPASAIEFGPAGNSVRLDACMVRSSSTQCDRVVMEATRPRTLTHCTTCAYPNAWVEPTPAASASLALTPWISRTDYEIRGSVGSLSVPTGLSGFSMSVSTPSVGVAAAV